MLIFDDVFGALQVHLQLPQLKVSTAVVPLLLLFPAHALPTPLFLFYLKALCFFQVLKDLSSFFFDLLGTHAALGGELLF